MGLDVYNQQAATTEDPYMLILKLYEGLLRYLTFVEEDYEISKDILQKRLKAMIAQNIWDFSAYYEIMNEKNEIFMRAYDVLKGNEYDLFDLTVN